MGYLRSKTTGKVYTTDLFKTGRYWRGPTFEFKKYPTTGQSMELELTVFTGADKLEV